MKGLRAASILIGALVDKLLFLPAAVALVWIVGTDSLRFQLAALVVGSSATCAGAYVGARHARTRPLAHGIAVGVVALALSFARFLANTFAGPELGEAVHPLWWELVAWSLALAAGAVGGGLASASPD